MFNWKEFLNYNRIFYLEEGKNVKSGCVAISCPYCSDDPSQHLNINLKTGRFKCWRNSSHKGTPAKLISTIKKCSYSEAVNLLNKNEIRPIALTLVEPELEKFSEVKPIELLPEFGYPDENTINYLINRGFEKQTVDDLIDRYNLLSDLSNLTRFKQRLILPIKENNHVVGWTGRAIVESVNRYVSYPSSIGSLIFNYDLCLTGGRALVIVEGPLDVLKADFYSPVGINFCGLMGHEITPGRVNRLLKLAKRHDSVYLSLDDDAFSSQCELLFHLGIFNPKFLPLPENIHDQGSMTPEQIKDYIEEIL